jgi:hypothetical protein
MAPSRRASANARSLTVSSSKKPARHRVAVGKFLNQPNGAYDSAVVTSTDRGPIFANRAAGRSQMDAGAVLAVAQYQRAVCVLNRIEASGRRPARVAPRCGYANNILGSCRRGPAVWRLTSAPLPNRRRTPRVVGRHAWSEPARQLRRRSRGKTRRPSGAVVMRRPSHAAPFNEAKKSAGCVTINLEEPSLIESILCSAINS